MLYSIRIFVNEKPEELKRTLSRPESPLRYCQIRTLVRHILTERWSGSDSHTYKHKETGYEFRVFEPIAELEQDIHEVAQSELEMTVESVIRGRKDVPKDISLARTEGFLNECGEIGPYLQSHNDIMNYLIGAGLPNYLAVEDFIPTVFVTGSNPAKQRTFVYDPHDLTKESSLIKHLTT